MKSSKYLQAKGAQLRRRTLHRCAQRAAAVGANPALEDGGASELDGGNPHAARRRELSEMLRFLLDELKLDIDADDSDIAWRTFHKGSPVCYMPRHRPKARR